MEPWQVRYGTNTLKSGHTGQYVTNMQVALKMAGYSVGNTDGVFGPGTETAVKNFQRANGLIADGEVGNCTKPVLYAASHP